MLSPICSGDLCNVWILLRLPHLGHESNINTVTVFSAYRVRVLQRSLAFAHLCPRFACSIKKQALPQCSDETPGISLHLLSQQAKMCKAILRRRRGGAKDIGNKGLGSMELKACDCLIIWKEAGELACSSCGKRREKWIGFGRQTHVQGTRVNRIAHCDRTRRDAVCLLLWLSSLSLFSAFLSL